MTNISVRTTHLVPAPPSLDPLQHPPGGPQIHPLNVQESPIFSNADPAVEGVYKIVEKSLGQLGCTPSVVNSLGVGGILSAVGSSSITANDLVFIASRIPDNQVGFLLMSDTVIAPTVPVGSNGNLCLGGSIDRFNSVLVNSGEYNEMRYELDLTDLPPTATAPTSGETRHFQFWYRDG